MPFFNALSDAIDKATPSRSKKKTAEVKAVAAVPPKPQPSVRGPSKNPEVMAAVEAAKKRSEAHLKKR